MERYNLCSIGLLSAEVNAGFASADYTAEEGTGLLKVCLEVFGSNSLSQSSLVRVQTIPGTAQGDYCTIHLTYLISLWVDPS